MKFEIEGNKSSTELYAREGALYINLPKAHAERLGGTVLALYFYEDRFGVSILEGNASGWGTPLPLGSKIIITV